MSDKKNRIDDHTLNDTCISLVFIRVYYNLKSSR